MAGWKRNIFLGGKIHDVLFVVLHDGADLDRVVMVQQVQDVIRLRGRQDRQDIRGLTGGHLVDQLRHFFDLHRLDQVALYVRVDLLQGVGGLLGVQTLEDFHALVGVHLLQDIRKVNGVQLGQLFLDHLELQVAPEAADVLGQRLDIRPGDRLFADALGQVVDEVRQARQAHAPQ